MDTCVTWVLVITAREVQNSVESLIENKPWQQQNPSREVNFDGILQLDDVAHFTTNVLMDELSAGGPATSLRAGIGSGGKEVRINGSVAGGKLEPRISRFQCLEPRVKRALGFARARVNTHLQVEHVPASLGPNSRENSQEPRLR